MTDLVLLKRVEQSIRPGHPAEILADLVRIPSENPHAREKEVAEYTACFLARLGLSVEVVEVRQGRPNVVARMMGKESGPVLAFNTHLDTVPAGEGWTREPFGGEIVGDRLYGRGAVDAKGPLAAFLAAIEGLALAGVVLRGELTLTAVMDEETGSLGARELVKQFRPDFAVVGEPTNLRVGIAHKGSLRPVLVVRGRSAHSSRPSEGVNAIYQAARVIEALRQYAADLPGCHLLCGAPSAAVTLVSGGAKENVIPDRCEITLDRRMIPGELEDKTLEQIETVLEELRLSSPQIEVAIDHCLPTTGPPSEMDPGHELVTICQESSRSAGGLGTLYGMSGTCDMTHFRALDVPAVVMGPGDAVRAHKPDEYIELGELKQGALAYAATALAICGVSQ